MMKFAKGEISFCILEALSVRLNYTCSDHPQLHAQVPASFPRGLRGSQDGRRVGHGELPDLQLHRVQVHGRHCLPE